MTIKIEIACLDYNKTNERRVRLWCEMIRKGFEIAPIKVVKRGDVWRVFSGAEAVEAAKRGGLTSLTCVVI